MLGNNNLKIVVFAPPSKREFLESYYGGHNVVIEGLDLEPVIRSKWNKFWYRFSFLLQNTFYVKDQRKERLYNHRNFLGYLNYFWVNLLAAIFSKLKVSRDFYRLLNFYFSPQNYFTKYILKYRPDLFFSTDIFSEYDVLFLCEARAKKIPVVGMVRSWDNTTTKGVLRVIPDKVIVNSPATKEELIAMHGLKEDDIKVVGLPQFDSWISGPTLSREEFFKKINADLSKKLIIFSPAGSYLSDTDWQICKILDDAIESGALPRNIQFLVRNHPAHPADLSKFRAHGNNFIFEPPGTLFGAGYRNMELQPSDSDHLRNLIFYSDIIIYIATSLGLDAAVFDKPQIIVSFDGWEEKPYVKSVRRRNSEDNLRNLIVLGGTRVAESKGDLISYIRRYLENQGLDSEGRRRIVGRHLYKIDGKAGERIAEFILGFLKGGD